MKYESSIPSVHLLDDLSHILMHFGFASLTIFLLFDVCHVQGFGFFVVKVDLTEDGIEHTDDIIKLIFQVKLLFRYFS